MGIWPRPGCNPYNLNAGSWPFWGNCGLNMAVFTQFYLQLSFFRADALRILR